MNSENLNSPNPARFRILVPDDEPQISDHLRRALRGPSFALDFQKDGDAILSALDQEDTPSLVILDNEKASHQGILKAIRYCNRDLPIILLAGWPAVHGEPAIDSGANQVLVKPFSDEELRRSIQDLLPSDRPAAAPPRMSKAADPSVRPGNWVRRMEPLFNRLKASDVPVLLQGETGVGKEVLARHIHDQSQRAGKIFLKLNCAALPSELVESELFGYEKGAFTGAFKSTCGKFELANGGTILLDEIGDMDLRLQAKLLHVLQDREFHRIGAKEPTQIDVRVIAATHRDLTERIARGEFREDLYYRLNVFNIVIPPLRERPDEIIPLASSFLLKHAIPGAPIPEIGPNLKTALLNHRWLGNIRELENVMRRYLIVGNSEVIEDDLYRLSARETHTDRLILFNGDHVPSAPTTVDPMYSRSDSGPLRPQESQNRPRTLSMHRAEKAADDSHSELAKLDDVLQAAETEVIMKTLHSTQWNRKRAASRLGVDYKAFLYKMKKLGIA